MTMKFPFQKITTIFVSLIICAVFFGLYFLRIVKYENNFSEKKSSFGPFETVTGVPITINSGTAAVTDGLAHLRIPYKLFKLGKDLSLQVNYQMDGASILEVGIRKSSFWLDYERKPIRNKILDDLAFTPHKPWKILSSDNGDTIFLSPYVENNFSSFNDFISNPPQKGTIGLYGNVVLDCVNKSCNAEPFQYWNDPKSYRAIYAEYTPIKDTTYQTSNLNFSLDNAFQNPDGSFDLMFFSFSKNNESPNVLYKNISASINPKVPAVGEISDSLKDTLKTLIFRNKSL
jgi:hypothetical protein